ncbi:helix-turn-helix domain-containing protein [Pseudomonas sp. Ps21-P2]|uniref:helix-turn-helix domain-containing protein n=1 Tax=Pseudomonas sp. Ps21-P2 TaxID=3080331 RepID=UPI00320AFEC2
MPTSLIVDRKASSRSFTKIPNHIISDPQLSLKAKGLITALLSLPPNWQLSVEGLAKHHRTGISAIRSAIKELEESGYLKSKRKYGAGRKFSGYEWHLTDLPEGREVQHPSQEKPYMENPPMEISASEKEKLINTNNTKKLKNKKTTTPGAQQTATAVHDLRIAAPLLTETRDQILRAVQQVEPADRQRMLDDLSAAIKSGAIKTTAVRWFHGVIKRYQEGAYNFKPVTPPSVPPDHAIRGAALSQTSTKDGPSSVKRSEPSSVGLEHLGKLKRIRSNSHPLDECCMTDEGRTSNQDNPNA